MEFRTRLKPTTGLIDLTPLVDVVFLLLIFFIITSDTLPLKSLKVERPSLEKKGAATLAQLPLIIDEQEVIYLGSKKRIVDAASLKELLIEEAGYYRRDHEGQQPTLMLNIDKRVSYELFLQVFAVVQQLGLPLRLAYREPDEDLGEER